MVSNNKVKDKSGYLFIASGISLGIAAFISAQLSFYAIGVMFILLGVVSLRANDKEDND
jgi:uncharacterized membrane protein HdeD (DUF308 family)